MGRLVPDFFLFFKKALYEVKVHGVKVGPEPQDPRPWDPDIGDRDPPQSLKAGPRTPLKFKNGTPSPFLNEFIFFRIFGQFFSYLIFLSFLNKTQQK